jgi:hypothetical protein
VSVTSSFADGKGNGDGDINNAHEAGALALVPSPLLTTWDAGVLCCRMLGLLLALRPFSLYVSTKALIAKFGTSTLEFSSKLLRGEVLLESIHDSIATRSYVCPSAATTGSSKTLCLIGHTYSSGASIPLPDTPWSKSEVLPTTSILVFGLVVLDVVLVLVLMAVFRLDGVRDGVNIRRPALPKVALITSVTIGTAACQHPFK